MRGLFIPGITAEMFRNGCLEDIENLMAEGYLYDIDYPSEQESKTEGDCIRKVDAIKCFFDDKGYYRSQLDILTDILKLPDISPQEPKTDVLDKIKAEIADFEEDIFHRTKDYSDYAVVRHCLEIIDKYRQEG